MHAATHLTSLCTITRLGASGCTSFAYTMIVSSVTGGFDIGPFTFSGGTPVATMRRATSTDIANTANDVALLSASIMAASQQIMSLQTQLNMAMTALNETRAELAVANARIQSLDALTADYGVLEGAVNNLTNCNGQGMLLDANNVCTHAVPLCPASPQLPGGVTLSYQGEPVPGTLATVVCPSGSYDVTTTVICQRNMTWSTVASNCIACPPHCTSCSGPATCTACESGRLLYSGHCLNGNGLTQTSPLLTCAAGKAANFPSGPR